MTFCPRKSPRLGLLRLWGAITLRANLWLKWGLKQSCSLCRELSNGISHTICTHENWIDFQLLMVESQIANLTPGPSFGHNLCFDVQMGNFRYLHSKNFHWYKKHFKPLSFDPYNRLLKIRESTKTPTPKVELHWGVKVHSFTPSHTPRNMLRDSRLPSWLATLQTFALVASPRLKLRHAYIITI